MRPAAAASAVTTTPMDSRRTSLSLVPNRETAKSLSQPGVRSMTVPPTARSGLEAGSRTCATRSATARVRAPATTPATASTSAAGSAGRGPVPVGRNLPGVRPRRRHAPGSTPRPLRIGSERVTCGTVAVRSPAPRRCASRSRRQGSTSAPVARSACGPSASVARTVSVCLPGVASQAKTHCRQVSMLGLGAQRRLLPRPVVDPHLDLVDAAVLRPRHAGDGDAPGLRRRARRAARRCATRS